MRTVDTQSAGIEGISELTDWGRGEVMVQFSGIRGPAVVAVDKIWGRPLKPSCQSQNVFLVEIEWPDLVDISDVVYFLGIEDRFGRQYDVFRQLQRQGRRIVVEAGRKS